MACISISYIIDTLERPETGVSNEALDEAIRQAAGANVVRLPPRPIDRYGFVNFGAPNYTGSLDAARTLLLPKHILNINQTGERSWLVTIFLREPAFPGRRPPCWEGEARTAEVALCIAAMKARVDR